MGTTVPACKATVLAILAARPALAGVTLAWSAPTKDEDFTEEMVFLGASDDTSDWAELGAGRRIEEYLLDLVVWVQRWGDDPQGTETRAHALWDEVEDALRDDIRSQPSTLRAAGVLQFNRVTRRTSLGPASPDTWGARIDARIQFQARNI